MKKANTPPKAPHESPLPSLGHVDGILMISDFFMFNNEQPTLAALILHKQHTNIIRYMYTHLYMTDGCTALQC